MAKIPFIVASGKIGRAIVVPYLVTSFITMVIVGGIVYYNYSTQTAEGVALQKEVGLQATSDINGYFGNILEALDIGRKSFSCIPDCTSQNNITGNKKILRALFDANPSIYQVTLVGTDGTELFTGGRYQLQNTGTIPLRNIASTERFTQSLQTQTHYLSQPYISQYDLPFITLGVPLVSESGAHIGVVLAEVDLSPMWGIVSKIKLGNTGYVYVVDKTGHLLVYKNINIVKKNQDLRDIRGVENFTNKVQGATIYPSFTGETVMGQWAPIEATGWGLIVELPQKEIWQNLYVLLSLSLSSLVLIGLFTFFLVRTIFVRLLVPVRTLHDGVQQIESGHLAHRVLLPPRDEFGELAIAFNEMTEHLQKYTTDLEAEVAERTEDLQKFKLAIENTSQHVIITNPEGIILYANPAVSQATGYAHAEIIGSKPSLWGKQMPKEFYSHMWHTIKDEKQTFFGELQNKKKNGVLYTASTIISPIVSATGELRFFVGLESDVSAQKALETALKEQIAETEQSKAVVLDLLEDIEVEKKKVDELVVVRTQELNEEKARLVSSINSIPFGFLIANNEGRILLMNGVLMELFHLDDREVLTLSDIAKRLGTTSDLESEVAACIKGQMACEMKEIILGAKFLRGIIAPIITGGEGTKTIGYVLLFEDITEARVLERSRDEFFSIASHELRTPLTAIRGNSEMIKSLYKDKIVDSDMSDMLNDIHEASVRLIDIVNDFLDVARLEQGNVTVDKTPFDIVEPIEQVFRDLRVPLEQKGLAFSFKKPYGLPLASGDKRRLEQVVMNLLGNAIKFSTKGIIGVEIIVELEKNHLKILVSDTGMGIAPENQALLFHKFQQAGEKILARDVTQGTGLGLYISKLLIERMGGIMGLSKSVPNEGSTFYFTLPIA